MDFSLEAAVFSHVGKVRSNNEDNYLLFETYRRDLSTNITQFEIAAPAQQTVAAVCDGMGGESAGEQASLIAVEALHPCHIDAVSVFVSQQISEANKRICDEINRRGGTRIGSTVAALYIDSGRAAACNLGDSRIYLLRGDILKQLSVDHSESQRLVDMGVIPKEKARQSSQKHRLTQHLGIFPDEFILSPEIGEPFELAPNDRFLICSDGLTDMVTDEKIKEELIGSNKAGEAARHLVDRALQAGGIDNVTVIVLDVKEPSSSSGLSTNLKNRLASALDKLARRF